VGPVPPLRALTLLMVALRMGWHHRYRGRAV